ncbi:18346_t:CDS:2, partial [Gigaspora margarita]
KGVSQVKLAERFGVAKATILEIICEKERTGKFSLLEETLALWVLWANIALQIVTGTIIQCKATQLAEKLEVIDAFDEFLEFGSDPPKTITIKNAIGFTTAAWKEYITADNHLITTEMPNDEEIIEAIKNYECIEPENEITNKLISFIQAFGFMNRILLFLKQQPDSSLNVNDSLIRNLKKLKKEVKLKYIALQ